MIHGCACMHPGCQPVLRGPPPSLVPLRRCSSSPTVVCHTVTNEMTSLAFPSVSGFTLHPYSLASALTFTVTSPSPHHHPHSHRHPHRTLALPAPPRSLSPSPAQVCPWCWVSGCPGWCRRCCAPEQARQAWASTCCCRPRSPWAP